MTTIDRNQQQNPAHQSTVCGKVCDCDLIVDPHPLGGIRNMALDAALLETGRSAERCIVRIYEWNEPTISLGYFQQHLNADRCFASLPHVRRITGGGAILHDREITYSCVLPACHPLRHQPSHLYAVMHRVIIDELTRCGVPAFLRRDFARLHRPNGGTNQHHPIDDFLCFLRSDPNDIVCAMRAGEAPGQSTIGGFQAVKIVGSAQRRRQGTILQHGSILMSASSLAPQVPGILQLFPEFPAADFKERLPAGLAAAIAVRTHRRKYLPQELELSEQFCGHVEQKT